MNVTSFSVLWNKGNIWLHVVTVKKLRKEYV